MLKKKNFSKHNHEKITLNKIYNYDDSFISEAMNSLK